MLTAFFPRVADHCRCSRQLVAITFGTAPTRAGLPNAGWADESAGIARASTLPRNRVSERRYRVLRIVL
jgi:hypothetical protein